jgi:hypothetical protein
VVKRSTPGPNPEVKGSNPLAGKEKKGKKLLLSDRKLKPRYFKNSPSSTMSEHLTHNPKVKGSNPPAGKENERQKSSC